MMLCLRKVYEKNDREKEKNKFKNVTKNKKYCPRVRPSTVEFIRRWLGKVCGKPADQDKTMKSVGIKNARATDIDPTTSEPHTAAKPTIFKKSMT